ncbi:MAG: helix-hairpin-helix domain-containing protein [Flavobacteriales bacterium]
MFRPTPKFKDRLKDMLHMHRGERLGMLLLSALCIAAMAWVTWEQWIRPRFVQDPSTLTVVWAAMADTSEQAYSSTGSPVQRDLSGIRPFNFDPNTITAAQWTELGLSDRQAASLLRYVERGGKFRSKADLAKMRVVAPELFALWEPFVQLPEHVERGNYADRGDKQWGNKPWANKDSAWKNYAPREPRPPRELVELNTADTVALTALPGIGPAFARSITRYRDRLGGFTSMDQLSEVYILKDKPDAVERIRGLLVLDPALAKHIAINTCTVEELAPHPYAGWKLAKALVAYRTLHGPYLDGESLKNCVLVSDSTMRRLAPYLDFR